MTFASLFILFSVQAGSVGNELLTDALLVDAVGQQALFFDDIDGDSIPDLLVASPYWDSFSLLSNGQLEIFSGRTNNKFATIVGSSDGQKLGLSILIAGDLDGDGVSDFCASEINGTITAYSGQTFSALYSVTVPWSSYYSYDPKLTLIADIDGDQIQDFLFSDGKRRIPPQFFGGIVAFSGASGSLLWSIDGSASSNYLGQNTAPADDLDLDGIEDVFATSRYLISCFSGVNGGLIWQAPHPNPASAQEEVIKIGDVNGDGFSDFALGGRYAARVSVVSGSDGTLLYVVKEALIKPEIQQAS